MVVLGPIVGPVVVFGPIVGPVVVFGPIVGTWVVVGGDVYGKVGGGGGPVMNGLKAGALFPKHAFTINRMRPTRPATPATTPTPMPPFAPGEREAWGEVSLHCGFMIAVEVQKAVWSATELVDE